MKYVFLFSFFYLQLASCLDHSYSNKPNLKKGVSDKVPSIPNNKVEIVETNIFKIFNGRKITSESCGFPIFIEYIDTLDGIQKFNVSINDKRIKSFYIYEKQVLTKEYQDEETLLLSNLESSFLFGKKKQIARVTPIYSTSGIDSRNNFNYDRYSGIDLNFFESGRFVDTYYITYHNLKTPPAFLIITLRIRATEKGFLLEKIIARQGIS